VTLNGMLIMVRICNIQVYDISLQDERRQIFSSSIWIKEVRDRYVSVTYLVYTSKT